MLYPMYGWKYAPVLSKYERKNLGGPFWCAGGEAQWFCAADSADAIPLPPALFRTLPGNLHACCCSVARRASSSGEFVSGEVYAMSLQATTPLPALKAASRTAADLGLEGTMVD
jgi:hypothetical protein